MLMQSKHTSRTTDFIKRVLLMVAWCLLFVGFNAAADCILSVEQSTPVARTTSPFVIPQNADAQLIVRATSDGNGSPLECNGLSIVVGPPSNSSNITIGNVLPTSPTTNDPTSGPSQATITLSGFQSGVNASPSQATYQVSCVSTFPSCTPVTFTVEVARPSLVVLDPPASYIGLRTRLIAKDINTSLPWASTDTITVTTSGASCIIESTQVNPATKTAEAVVSSFTPGTCPMDITLTANGTTQSASQGIVFQAVPIVITATPGESQYTGETAALTASLAYPTAPPTADRVNHTFVWDTPTGIVYQGSNTTTSAADHTTSIKHTQAGGKVLQVTLEEAPPNTVTGSIDLNAADPLLTWNAPLNNSAETINQGAPALSTSTTMTPATTLNNTPSIPSGSEVNYTLSGTDCSGVFLGGTAGTTSINVPVDASGNAPLTIAAENTGATTDKVCTLVGTLRYPNIIAPVVTQTVTITVPGVVAPSYTLSIVTPQPPAGAVNTVSNTPMKVLLKDNNNPSANQTITWTLLNGDLTLDATSTSTDTNGESALGFTHGGSAGTSQVRAELSSDPNVFVVFDITTNNTTTTSKTLTIGSPTPSNDTVGAYSDTPFLVIAKNDGNLVEDVTINWSVIQNATLSNASTQTDANGQSSNDFRFGNDVGDVIVEAVRADNSDAKVRFTLKATAKPVWKIEIISGNNQTVTINQQAPEALRVRVTKDGKVAPDTYVNWASVDGELTAKADRLTTKTDAQGETGINYTPSKLGETKAYATLSGGELAEFTIQAIDAQSNQKTLTLYGNMPEDGLIDTAGRSPLQIIAEDNGKPANDVTITWQVVRNGLLDQTSTQTDAAGISQNTFRYGSTVGETVFIAQRSDAPSASVTFTTNTKQPSNATYAIDVVQGNGQSLPIDSNSDELVVLTSADGQAQSSVPVLFDVVQGDASFAFRDTISGADGQARAIIKTGSSAGNIIVKATRTDTNQSVMFDLTAQKPNDPVSLTLTLTDGNNQNIAVNALSEALQVTVTDDQNKPYPDANIVFETDERLGSLTSSNGITDANGQASTQIQLTQPSATSVIAKLVDAQNNELARVVFSINASFAVDQLPIGQRPIGQVFNNVCARLAALEQRTPGQEDLFQRCREVGDGDSFGDILETITALEINGNATMTVARTQMNNVKARLDALKNGATGLDLRGLSVNAPNGSLSLGLLQDEQSNMSQDGNPNDDVFDRWGFFANGSIGQGKFDPKTNMRSYDFDINGITAGVDYRFRPSLVGGLALGFSKQDTTFYDGSTSKLSGYSGTAYLTWYNKQNWYVDGQLTYGSNSFDVVRSISYRVMRGDQVISDITQTGRGSFDATMFAASLAAGRDFSINGWNLNPYARYDYTINRFDELKEDLNPENGQGLALTAQLDDLTSSALVAGGQATYNHSTDWGVLMPNLMIEYQRELNDDASTFEAHFSNDPAQERFRINGTPLDRSYLRMGVGLSALFPGGRSAYIYYEYLRGEQLKMGNVNLGMRWEF